MHILIFWNEHWKYQIEAFNRSDITFDVMNVNQGLVEVSKCYNAKNIFSYNGPAWNKRTKEDEDNILKLYKKVLMENKYDYIFPAWMDSQLPALAIANEYFELKGIRPEPLEHLSGKDTYGKILKKLNISTPIIFDSKDSAKFPVICKPSFGTGGEGIKVCYNLEELEQFLKDDNNQKFYPYILQEYIEGTIVCVVGTITNKVVSIDLMHEIEITNPPYCAETAWKFPTEFRFLENLIEEDLKTFSSYINLDNTPFMLDLVVDSFGKYYFIDFSPRISSSIYHLMYYTNNANYFYNVFNKIVNGIDFEVNMKHSFLLRHFKFDTGIIKSIHYENVQNIKELNLPAENDIVREIKNDFDIHSNGYYSVIAGDSLDDVERVWDILINSIQVEYQS